MAIKFHKCIVPRRGKAAKGTIEIETLGEPVKPKEGNVVKKWEYSKFNELYSEAEVLETIRKIGDSIEIMMRGADMFLRSETNRGQSHVAVLSARVLSEGLAIDKAEAKSVAIAILTARTNMQKLGLAESLIPSVDAMLESRKAIVDKMKKDGNWVSKPRLVKDKPVEKEQPESEESDEDLDDEDSDDEEETEE